MFPKLPFAPIEQRMSLPQLARAEGVSPVTVWRWALRGIRGIKLPILCVGNKRYTTHAAFALWCEQTTASANGEPIPSRTSRQRERDIERAERELAAAGIL